MEGYSLIEFLCVRAVHSLFVTAKAPELISSIVCREWFLIVKTCLDSENMLQSLVEGQLSNRHRVMKQAEF